MNGNIEILNGCLWKLDKILLGNFKMNHILQLPVIKGYLMPKTGILKSLELISSADITDEIIAFFKIDKLYNKWQSEYIKMTFMLDEENEHVWYIGRHDFGEDRFTHLNWMIGKEIDFSYQGISRFK